MSLFEQQLDILKKDYPSATITKLPSGAHLIYIPDIDLPAGWNRAKANVLFVAPAGFPGAAPDCFWVEPGGLRLQDGRIPQATNDTNPIPEVGPRGTWFSWHVQQWNPSSDSLRSYFKVVMSRLGDAR